MQASLRIAMVAPGEVFGGAERQILYLLAYFRQQGHQCHLICFHERDFADRARALGIPTTVLPAKPPIRWSNVRAIAALVASLRIQILHVHGYKAAVHVALARRLATFDVVKTEHGRLELPAQPLAKFKTRLFRWIENRATRAVNAHVVYVTEDLRASCRGEHARLESSVILNGIDFAAIAAQERPRELTRETCNAVVVGRLEAIKGIAFAIRALARPEVPKHVCLWIVGEGPLKAELEALVSSLALTDRVRFTGFRKDAVAFIAHADLLIMPSLHEGLPYTLLEAVAARVPVIASHVGGLAEVLEHRRTALLTQPANVDEVARAIAEVATDRQLAATLAQNAHARLIERHTIEQMGNDYWRIYSSRAAGCLN